MRSDLSGSLATQLLLNYAKQQRHDDAFSVGNKSLEVFFVYKLADIYSSKYIVIVLINWNYLKLIEFFSLLIIIEKFNKIKICHQEICKCGMVVILNRFLKSFMQRKVADIIVNSVFSE